MGMSQSENPSSNQSSDTQKSSETALPPPCAGGCGFYGSVETKNYCSQCFKKIFPDEATKSVNNKNNIANNNNSNNDDNESKQDSNIQLQDNEEKKPKKKVQKKKNRCWQCRKKMTLAGQFE